MAVGPAEILVILIVGLLVFGPQRLPEIGRQVGAALRELRKMQDAMRGELDMVLHPEHGTRSADDVIIEPDDHSAIDPATPDGPDATEPPAPPPFSGPSGSFS
jgi:sec-independent protein translocase protein TatA